MDSCSLRCKDCSYFQLYHYSAWNNTSYGYCSYLRCPSHALDFCLSKQLFLL